MAKAPVELIKSVSLFSDLDDRELREVASSMRERTGDAGDTVTQEGARAASVSSSSTTAARR